MKPPLPSEMVAVTSELFLQLGVIVIIAGIAALILRYFRQPQILAYVLVGLLITPLYELITGTSALQSGVIQSMSLIGVAFLLFIVGLEMDLRALRNVALVSTLGGAIQVIILFVFGYFVSLLLGFLSLEAVYIGLMLAFSSTMVVVKLLSDRRELNTLHGHITIGFLIVQDIVAILALSLVGSLNSVRFSLLAIAFFKFLFLFALAFVASKYVFPPIFRFSAKHQELLLINSLAVCFLFALGFEYLGFSLAIGAFIAGLSLGSLEYNLDIMGKIKGLKDFFSLLFFVSLGMGISLGIVKRLWFPILVILLLVLILKPFVIMLVCSMFRFTKKPSFLTANALAQVGEFSLILAVQGLALGHLSQDVFSITVMVTLLSITLTSYYIEYNEWFYHLLRHPLRIFDTFTTEGLEFVPSHIKPEILLCGHNRIGYSILQGLSHVKTNVLIVDYNPEIIARLAKQGYHCLYGDVTDEEVQDKMHLNDVRMVISTVPDINDNVLLIHRVRRVNRRAKIFVTAADIEESLQLYEKGADYVILPHFLGGEHASALIENIRIRKLDLDTERKKHIEHLRKRKEMRQEHPKG